MIPRAVSRGLRGGSNGSEMYQNKIPVKVTNVIFLSRNFQMVGVYWERLLETQRAFNISPGAEMMRKSRRFPDFALSDNDLGAAENEVTVLLLRIWVTYGMKITWD